VANFRSFTSTSGWSATGGLTANPYVLDHNACGSSSARVREYRRTLRRSRSAPRRRLDRLPSGVDGSVGIKPTLGEVSRSGVVPLSSKQDTPGPITRNVTDAAAVLSVIGAPDAADPATSATVVQDFTKDLDKKALQGKRIGVWLDPNSQGDPGAATLAVSIRPLRSCNRSGDDRAGRVAESGCIGSVELNLLEYEFKHDINAYLAATPGKHPPIWQVSSRSTIRMRH